MTNYWRDVLGTALGFGLVVLLGTLITGAALLALLVSPWTLLATVPVVVVVFSMAVVGWVRHPF